LIASPGLVDPNFVRTVVFVAEHNEEGALGLVLNRPSDLKISDLWASISGQASTSGARALVGGPVQKNAVLLLHGEADLAKEAEPIVPGVYLGGEVGLLGDLLKRESSPAAIFPLSFRVFCGYSGWGAGQLDAEMKAGGWLTSPASAEHVFHPSPEKLWNSTLGALGGVYKFFSLMPSNPEMN
jgi:putative transcriptional regulator